MSSDESETDDNHHTQYQILAPLWRDRHLAAWLRVFDSLHHILRRGSDAYASRGAFPRHRKVGQQRSTNTTFVSGLPINVYDHHWITQDARRKYDLRPSTEQYDFSHEPDIMECVILCWPVFLVCLTIHLGWLYSLPNSNSILNLNIISSYHNYRHAE